MLVLFVPSNLLTKLTVQLLWSTRLVNMEMFEILAYIEFHIDTSNGKHYGAASITRWK